MKKYVNGRYIEMTPEEEKAFAEKYEEYLNGIDYKVSRINEIKKMLADTDYISCKIAEGVATKEEYSKELEQRQAWREEINRLENEVKNESTSSMGVV